jgi:hypothetical protein
MDHSRGGDTRLEEVDEEDAEQQEEHDTHLPQSEYLHMSFQMPAADRF